MSTSTGERARTDALSSRAPHFCACSRPGTGSGPGLDLVCSGSGPGLFRVWTWSVPGLGPVLVRVWTGSQSGSGESETSSELRFLVSSFPFLVSSRGRGMTGSRAHASCARACFCAASQRETLETKVCTFTASEAVPLLLLLAALASSAPLGPQASDRTQILVRAQTLVQKILQSLVQIHAQTVTSSGLTFDPSSPAPELHLMMSQLQITPPPVPNLLSPSFSQEDCVRWMWAGLEQQQRIVGDLSSRLSALRDLHADLCDLQGQTAAMMSAMGGVTPSPVQSGSSILTRLHGDYETEVATHLTLTNLRDFCHDLSRGLRKLGPRPL